MRSEVFRRSRCARVASAGALLLSLLSTHLSAAGDDAPGAAPPKTYSPRDTVRGVVVDEQGSPAAGAIVRDLRGRYHGDDRPAVTDDRGQFKLGGPPGHWRYSFLIARSPDGAKQGWLPVDEERAIPRRLEMVLKPARSLVAHVVDGQNQPVAGATIEVIASYISIAVATSDETGSATFSLPVDAPVDWVIAFKDDLGCDYVENYESFPSRTHGQLPAELKLVLAGARPAVEVLAVTPDDKPLAGVDIMVWTIKKKGKLAYANIGGALTTRATTGSEGRARFAWLPHDLETGVSFLVDSKTHHAVEGLHFNDGAAPRATLKPNGTIHGKVTHTDGTPAAQILLQAEGNGSPHYFRGFARSDEDGNYSFNVYADQTYTLQVLDDAWAAKSHAGELVALGDKPHEVNFQLLAGTLIEGTLTIGADHAPFVGETATLTQDPQFVRWAQSDERGHYQFRVGPGEYKLMLPTGSVRNTIAITVTDQASIVHDAHSPRKPRGPLQGTVRRKDDGSVVGGARILAESTTQRGHAGFHCDANSEGVFRTERWRDPLFLVARDIAGNQAGCARVGEDDDSCAISVSPAATIVGRVVDEAGQPIAGARLVCSISAPRDLVNEDEVNNLRPRQPTVQFNEITPDDGTFTLPAIPVGSQASLYVNWNERNTDWKTLEIKAAEQITAGDIVIKPAEAPKNDEAN